MNHFGNSSSQLFSPQFIVDSCFFDECLILKKLNQLKTDELNLEVASKSFKYFISENSILLAFFNCQSAQKSICLIRSPFGKFCWSIKFQSLPFKKSSHYSNTIVPRPVHNSNTVVRKAFSPRFFPDGIEKIPLIKV